jgi:hypothetical protein
MFTDRRSYSLSTDQPILKQARRRRAHRHSASRRGESEFWKSFNMEKLCTVGGHANLDRLPTKGNTAS